MELARYTEERIQAGDFPGAVFLAREAGRADVVVARGDAVVVPERIPIAAETIFDLASLTKPLATALLAALAVEDGALDMDAPVASYLEEFARPVRDRITIRHLLTHTSGLPKWLPLYADPGDPARVLDHIATRPLAYETGARVVYSDPGFITLGAAVERALGDPLDALFADRVAGPLGLADTGFRPDASKRPRIAASEVGNEFERAMCGEACAGYAGWRTNVVWGEVHDGNAHFLGGVAGHAGLFGTAREVARVAEQFLPGSLLFRDERTLGLFRENMTPGLEEHRSAGWMLASTPGSAAGAALPPDAFGHLGFTGTSVWVDPERARVYVFLTNRTHPAWRDVPMNATRRRANELAAAALDERVNERP